MSTQSEYRIYCITESAWVSAWATAPITQCPNNPAHTVNSNSVQEITVSTLEILTSASADPSFITTLISNQTSNRTITLPDVNDTLVCANANQALTNKSILCDGSGNTIEATHMQAIPITSTVPTVGQFTQFDGAQWEVTTPFNPRTTAFLFDDFIGNAVKSIWATSTTGAGSSIGIVDGVGGQVQLESGTTISDNVELSSGSRIVNVASNSTITFRILLSDLTDTLVRIGLRDTSSNAIDFIFDTSVSANWHSRTIAGGADTTNDTLVPATTNWTEFQIIATAGSVEFYIDGTLHQTHNTNIPVGLLTISAYQESLSGASRNTRIDYIQLSGNRESPPGSSSTACIIM